MPPPPISRPPQSPAGSVSLPPQQSPAPASPYYQVQPSAGSPTTASPPSRPPPIVTPQSPTAPPAGGANGVARGPPAGPPGNRPAGAPPVRAPPTTTSTAAPSASPAPSQQQQYGSFSGLNNSVSPQPPQQQQQQQQAPPANSGYNPNYNSNASLGNNNSSYNAGSGGFNANNYNAQNTTAVYNNNYNASGSSTALVVPSQQNATSYNNNGGAQQQPQQPIESQQSFNFTAYFCGADATYIHQRMRALESTLPAEVSRQIGLLLARQLNGFPLTTGNIKAGITDISNGFVTVEGTIGLGTDSKSSKREAIAVIGAFLTCGEPFITAIGVAIGQCQPSNNTNSGLSYQQNKSVVQLDSLTLSKAYVNDVMVFPQLARLRPSEAKEAVANVAFPNSPKRGVDVSQSYHTTTRLMAPSRNDIVYGEGVFNNDLIGYY